MTVIPNGVQVVHLSTESSTKFLIKRSLTYVQVSTSCSWGVSTARPIGYF